MINISYDKEADACYIELSKGEFYRNKVIEDRIIIDYDVNDNILGIEILDFK